MDPEAFIDTADGAAAAAEQEAGNAVVFGEDEAERNRPASELYDDDDDDDDDEVLQLSTEHHSADPEPAQGVESSRSSKRRSAAAPRYGAEDDSEEEARGRGRTLGTVKATKAPGAPIEPDGKLRVCLACKENHRTIFQCRTKSAHDAPNWNEEQKSPQEYHHNQLKARQLQEDKARSQLHTQVRYPSTGRRTNPDRFTPSLAPDRPKGGAGERPPRPAGQWNEGKRPVGRPPLHRPQQGEASKPLRKVATGPIQAEERGSMDPGRLDRVCSRCKPNHRTIQQCRREMGHTEPNWCQGGKVAPNRYTARGDGGDGPRRPASSRKKRRSQFYDGDSDSWEEDDWGEDADQEGDLPPPKRPRPNGHHGGAYRGYQESGYEAYYEEDSEPEEIVIEGESYFEEDKEEDGGGETDEEHGGPPGVPADEAGCHTWSLVATKKLTVEDITTGQIHLRPAEATAGAAATLGQLEALFAGSSTTSKGEVEVILSGFAAPGRMACKLARAEGEPGGFRLCHGWRECLTREVDFGTGVPIKEGAIVQILQNKAPNKEPEEPKAGSGEGDKIVEEGAPAQDGAKPEAEASQDPALALAPPQPPPTLVPSAATLPTPLAAAAPATALAVGDLSPAVLLIIRIQPAPMPGASAQNKILVKKISSTGASQPRLRLPETAGHFFNDMTPEEENQAQDAALVAAENRRKEERAAIAAAEAAAAGESEAPGPSVPTPVVVAPPPPPAPISLFGGMTDAGGTRPVRAVDDFGQIWDFTIWRRARDTPATGGGPSAEMGGGRSTRAKTKQSYDYYLTGGWEEYRAARGVKAKDTLVMYRGDSYRIGLHLQLSDDEAGREPLHLEELFAKHITESDMEYWKLGMPSQSGRIFFPGPPDFKDKTVDLHLADEQGVYWEVVIHQRMHQTRNLHVYEATTGWANIRSAKGIKKGDTLLVLRDATGGLHLRVVQGNHATSSIAASKPRPRPVPVPRPAPVPARPAQLPVRHTAPKYVKKRPKPMLPPPRPKVREIDLHKRNKEIEERKGFKGPAKKTEPPRAPQQMLEPIQLSTKAAMSIDNKANRDTATVVFLGDSIIMGIPSHLYQGRCIQNFGKNGACAEDLQVLSRSQKFNAECSMAKKAIVMAVGTNNLWKDPVDIVVNQIMEVIEVLCHNYQAVHIIVIGVLPRGDTGYVDIDSLNRKIATFNRQLRHKVRNVDEHIAARVTFMDLGNKFMTEGKIVAKMYIADGIHLSSAGYEFFMGEVNTQLDGVVGPTEQPEAEEDPEAQAEESAGEEMEVDGGSSPA